MRKVFELGCYIKNIAIAIFCFIPFVGYTQIEWEVKEVGCGISVEFPIPNNYELKNGNGVYSAKTDNCLLFAIIQYNVFPNYNEFVKLPNHQQDSLIGIFLDNMAKGILKATGKEDIKPHKIMIGNSQGREFYIKGVNPASGNLTGKYYKLTYAFNKAFMFQAMQLTDDDASKKEATYFINSIKK